MDTKNDTNILGMPREVTLLFSGFDKLNDLNWTTWKGHMKDNLDMCGLWEIVCGKEEQPLEAKDAKAWASREKIARITIKNSLGPKDYHQVRFAKTADHIWRILEGLHESTGAQGIIDMIWKFWSMRCVEGASAREHIGEIRALHMELAENGITIDNYLLAIALSKSLPPSYDNYVSTIFASIHSLNDADPDYIANKIFEEEIRRSNKSEDANIAVPKRCLNCRKNGHLKDDCYSKGGGKEGQGPRQIARRKRQKWK